MATLSSIISLSSLPPLRRHLSLSPFPHSLSLSFSRIKPRSPFLLIASSAHSFDDFTSKSKVPFFHSFIPYKYFSSCYSSHSFYYVAINFPTLYWITEFNFLYNFFLISWCELFYTSPLTGAVKNNYSGKRAFLCDNRV